MTYPSKDWARAVCVLAAHNIQNLRPMQVMASSHQNNQKISLSRHDGMLQVPEGDRVSLNAVLLAIVNTERN
jgi:hypothetical protein